MWEFDSPYPLQTKRLILDKGLSKTVVAKGAATMFTKLDQIDNLGKNVDIVVTTLTAKCPGMAIYKVPEGNKVTMDYNLNRIRVWFNPSTQLVSSITNG
jgi:hypothetical protein